MKWFWLAVYNLNAIGGRGSFTSIELSDNAVCNNDTKFSAS
jgi:hypothetical protein